MIREVEIKDARQICEIYNYYVKNTVITFEEEPVSFLEMEKRIKKIIAAYPWIVFEEKGKVMAYAYAAPWRVRSAYRYSSELTVYVDYESKGKKLGTLLYRALIDRMKEKGLHCLYGVIALPNKGSVALHEKQGFTKCGHFHEVGKKFDKWIDVGYWEKNLEKS